MAVPFQTLIGHRAGSRSLSENRSSGLCSPVVRPCSLIGLEIRASFLTLTWQAEHFEVTVLSKKTHENSLVNVIPLCLKNRIF